MLVSLLSVWQPHHTTDPYIHRCLLKIVKAITLHTVELRTSRVKEHLIARVDLIKGLFLSKAASVLAYEIVLNHGKLSDSCRIQIFVDGFSALVSCYLSWFICNFV